MFRPNTQELGQHAEQQAQGFLQTKGFKLLAKNYRCFHGEIDLIMRDRDDIVFVEVRSRSRHDYGEAAETINTRKKRKLIKTGMHFLQKKDWLYKVNSRFDVIAIHIDAGKTQIEWIENAFSVEK